MNIFLLDKDPIKSAQMHHDKHVIKMILESAQLLCTAHRVLDGELYIDNSSGRKIKRWKLELNDDVIYKATHVNHPSNIWTRTSKQNYIWLYDMFIGLCNEYTYRYGKIHATQNKLEHILKCIPKNISNLEIAEIAGITQMPQAMPEKYHDTDSVEAYRKYYKAEKINQSKYTNRNEPYWI